VTEIRDVIREACAEVGWAPGPSFGEVADVETQRAFYLALRDRGWAVPTWPTEYGGGGRSYQDLAAFVEQAARVGAPSQYNRVAVGIVGPAILEFGTEDQRHRFLPRIADGSEIWCQGFSEPSAGSDLASLQTRAELTSGGWVINGQKVWTTLGCLADYCFLLVRTGSREDAHRGITALLVPMRQTGVIARPIRQISGESDFAEIFFDDAVADRSAVLGEVNGGWRVAMRALEYERSLHFLERQVRLDELADRLVRLCLSLDPGVGLWPAVVEVLADVAALRYAIREFVDGMASDRRLGVEINGTKVLWSETYRAVTRLGVAAARESGDLDEVAAWSGAYYSSLATSIYGGTNEIQREIVSERGLGLARTR
jgi:alkylation response protein AidB-like acyl-CoA dehydrogenase